MIPFEKIQYKDIVIQRGVSRDGRNFFSVLAEEGIPAYSVSREGYLKTYEISVLFRLSADSG